MRGALQRSLDEFGPVPIHAPEGSPTGGVAPPSTLPTPSDAWGLAAPRFEEAVREEGDVSAVWRHTMRRYVERMPSLLAKVGLPGALGPEEITGHHLRALREGLGWTRSSLRVLFASLRRYLRWEGLPLAEDPRAWRLPSGEAARRRWLEKRDLLRLWARSKGACRVVVALEGFNGLRRVEVLRLRVQDVDREEHRLRVRGKGRYGGKWRTIPMAGRVEEAIEAWRREQAIGSGRLLDYSPSGLNVMLARTAREAKLPRRVSNHDLRRTFGRLAYQSGMSLVDVRNILGHESVDETVVYIGLDEEQMRAGLARFEQAMRRPIRGRLPPSVPRTSGAENDPRAQLPPQEPARSREITKGAGAGLARRSKPGGPQGGFPVGDLSRGPRKVGPAAIEQVEEEALAEQSNDPPDVLQGGRHKPPRGSQEAQDRRDERCDARTPPEPPS